MTIATFYLPHSKRIAEFQWAIITNNGTVQECRQRHRVVHTDITLTSKEGEACSQAWRILQPLTFSSKVEAFYCNMSLKKVFAVSQAVALKGTKNQTCSSLLFIQIYVFTVAFCRIANTVKQFYLAPESWSCGMSVFWVSILFSDSSCSVFPRIQSLDAGSIKLVDRETLLFLVIH